MYFEDGSITILGARFRICKELDGLLEGFCSCRLEGEYPYLWLDAFYLKVRQNHRIVNQTMVNAIGLRETGKRDVLGFALEGSQEEAFWLDVLRGLVRRDLQGLQLLTRDAHGGLKSALGQGAERRDLVRLPSALHANHPGSCSPRRQIDRGSRAAG